MKIDEQNNVSQMAQVQMIGQMFKNSMGDESFQMVMESLLSAMKQNDGAGIDLSSLGLEEADLSKLGYGGGQRIASAFSDVNDDMTSGNMNIDEAVERASRKYGVDKSLIMAVIKQESSFDPNAKSWAGAMGLMQLMPENCTEYGVANPYNVEQNVDGGTHQLKDLLKKYGGDVKMALAAYNAGMGTLARRGVVNEDGISRLPKETREYVVKVMKNYGK